MAKILPVVKDYILNEELMEELNKAIDYKICYLKSPAGYGKTALLSKWLENKKFDNVYWCSFRKVDSIPSIFFKNFFGGLKNKLKNINIDRLYLLYREAKITPEEMANIATLIDEELEMIFVLDDFQNLASECIRLLKSFIISTRYKCQFIISSRDEVPLEFSDLLIKNQIYFIDQGFSFGYKQTKDYFLKRGFDLSDNQIDEIIEYTNGWVPSYVAIANELSYYKESNKFRMDYIFSYIKQSIYDEYDGLTKSFINMTSVLTDFTEEMISKLLGIKNNDLNVEFKKCEQFFVKKSDRKYSLMPLMRDFIKQNILQDELNKIYITVADYFLSRKKYSEAMRFFVLGKNYVKMVKALEEFSKEHNYINYDEISDILYLVPNYFIYKSPTTIMAIVIDSFNKFKFNMVWFYLEKLNMLEGFCEGESLERLKMAQARLCLYNLNLSNEKIFDSFKQKTITPNNNLIINPSVIFPSTIRGLRDFSDMIKSTFDLELKYSLPFVFGNEGNDYYDISLAEISLERGNLSDALARVNSILYKSNSVEIYYVATNILVRIYTMLNQLDECSKALKVLKRKIIEGNKTYLLANFRAMSVKYYLAAKNFNIVNDWLIEHTNSDFELIDFKEFYIYKNKIRVLIHKKEYEQALKITDSLISRCLVYKRYIDLMEFYYVKFIIYYVFKKEEMINELKKSLDIAMPINYKLYLYEYGITAINALEYILEYLNDDYYKYIKNILNNKTNYIKKVEEITISEDMKNLSKAEIQVLKLLERGYSNNDICLELDIKLTTTKTHISRIFNKLGVKNRSQAVKIAKELDLI